MGKIIAIAISILALGCGSDSIQEAYDSAKNKISELAPVKDQYQNLAQEELNKLYSFEYKVVEFPLTAESLSIEAYLSTLGKDRWECFDTTKTDLKLIIFCKRRPETYLKYIPRAF